MVLHFLSYSRENINRICYFIILKLLTIELMKLLSYILFLLLLIVIVYDFGKASYRAFLSQNSDLLSILAPLWHLAQ